MPEGSEHQRPADLIEAVGRLAEVERLLVALDFDGTLAPFADDPAEASALPGSWAAVLTLDRARDTEVALVSGRSLAGLAAVTRAPRGVALVGSHGAEWRVPGYQDSALSAEERTRAERLGAVLDAVAERYPGARVERKPAGVGLHTRGVSAAAAGAAQEEARRAVLASDPDAIERAGHDILEFAVRPVTKGDAVDRLREMLRVDAVFFAGDDVTDEDALRAMRAGDVGVKVGEGETSAAYRVPDPIALTDVLRALARARATRQR